MRPLGKDLEAVFYDPSTVIINLNWDLTLWNDERIHNIIQLHGRADREDTLILPSQYYVDLKNLMLSQSPPRIGSYISRQSAEALALAHQKAMAVLKACQRAYLWGAHIHAYDVEVLALLRSLQEEVKTNASKKLYFLNKLSFQKRAKGLLKILAMKNGVLRYPVAGKPGYPGQLDLDAG